MYLSNKWLNDYIDIPKSIEGDDLGRLLTVHTVEIDGVEKQSLKYKNMVVGQILEIRKHAQADKLQVAIVDIKSEKLQIVCGAPNIEVGQKVPVALVGALMPGGMEIKQATIRGEESSGMMCAEDELGLGEDHAGIMVLGENAKIGTPLADYLELDDVIYEVDNKSITNRPDLWCHYGMAREIAVFLDKKLKSDQSTFVFDKIKTDKKEVKLKVSIQDKKLCRRYSAVAIGGIKVEPSPKWMQSKLISSGIRPINNIVDITNFVMLEFGQPMHAFDAEKINLKNSPENIKISIRPASKGEPIKTLDGEDRILDAQDLVIASDDGPIAIAGVMGGEDSEISEESSVIILESANFDNISIRRTARKFSLRSEASQRFEKSLDPSTCETGLVRAVDLIKRICPNAYISSDIVDEGSFEKTKKTIEFEKNWLDNFLGHEISTKEIERILSGLGFAFESEDELIRLLVPSWRNKDVNEKEDIAEEIARIYSYDNIVPRMPMIEMKINENNISRWLDFRIGEILSGAPGMFEVSNYSFVGEEQLKNIGLEPDNYIKLANPISQNHTMLRQSLATNMFENVKKNQARFEKIELFEIGSAYYNLDGQIQKSNEKGEVLPAQEKKLGLLVAGKSNDVFMRIKGIISFLFSSFDLEVVYDHREDCYYWGDKRYCTNILVGNKPIGYINLLEEKVAKKIGVKKTVAVAEIRLFEMEVLLSAKDMKTYKASEKFPSLIRDLSFIVNEKISYNKLKNEIMNFHDYISAVDLFDEYQGEEIGKNKKSLAFHVSYQTEKTLTSAEVDEIQSGLISHLEQNFEAKIRDF